MSVVVGSYDLTKPTFLNDGALSRAPYNILLLVAASCRLTSVVCAVFGTGVSAVFALNSFFVDGVLPLFFGFERDDAGRLGLCIVEERVAGRGETMMGSLGVEVEEPGVDWTWRDLVASSTRSDSSDLESPETAPEVCTLIEASVAAS